MIASKILDRNSSTPNLLKVEIEENKNNLEQIEFNKVHKDHIFKPTSNITPYILLIALSIHGSIEGIALGVMNTLKECSILFTAILLHKWAEAFALGAANATPATDAMKTVATNKLITFLIFLLLFFRFVESKFYIFSGCYKL